MAHQGGPRGRVIELDRLLVQPHADGAYPWCAWAMGERVSTRWEPAFKGRVRGVSQGGPARAALPVEVEIKNTESYDLKAGMFARLSVEYGQAARMVLVPKDALILRPRGASVFVFEKGRVREVSRARRKAWNFLHGSRAGARAGMQVVVERK